MNITITQEQFNKMRRLLDFADFWADDSKPDSDFYLDQWESDKEEILQAQEVIQDIDALIYFQEKQVIQSARTDAWIKQANQDMREGKA
jgi:hypothetical protein